MNLLPYIKDSTYINKAKHNHGLFIFNMIVKN